ncbi:unnamed protein product [Urochloa humidicola]
MTRSESTGHRVWWSLSSPLWICSHIRPSNLSIRPSAYLFSILNTGWCMLGKKFFGFKYSSSSQNLKLRTPAQTMSLRQVRSRTLVQINRLQTEELNGEGGINGMGGDDHEQ